MIEDFTFDLLDARKSSGLTQVEASHLIGVDKSEISRWENGERLPGLHTICALSLVYGRTFESLFGAVFDEVRAELSARLATLPQRTKDSAFCPRLKRTLERIRSDLNALDFKGYGTA